jgi:predicted house-cleaning NTP pyrophosphatase (Maf/HAM1 superfamily)
MLKYYAISRPGQPMAYMQADTDDPVAEATKSGPVDAVQEISEAEAAAINAGHPQPEPIAPVVQGASGVTLEQLTVILAAQADEHRKEIAALADRIARGVT